MQNPALVILTEKSTNVILTEKNFTRTVFLVNHIHRNDFLPFFLQYCEYYPDYEGCKKWLEENNATRISQMSVGATETEEDAKKDKNFEEKE